MKLELTHTVDLKSILNSLSEKEQEKVMKHLVSNMDLLSLQKSYDLVGLQITRKQREERERAERAAKDPKELLLAALS